MNNAYEWGQMPVNPANPLGSGGGGTEGTGLTYNSQTGQYEATSTVNATGPGGGGGGGGNWFTNLFKGSNAGAAAGGAAAAGGTVADTSGSSGWGDALQTILKLYGAYQSSKPGTFKQIPQSPEEVALRQKMLDYLKPGGSQTRTGLASILDQYAKGARVGGDFHLPTFGGYTPGQPFTMAPYDPNQRYGASLDFSKLFDQNGASGASTSAPTSNVTPTGGGTPAGTGLGGSGGGASSPFTLGGNPSSPQTSTGSIDWATIGAYAKQYGKAAAEGLLGFATANPSLIGKALVDAYHAYSAHGQTGQLPTYPQTGTQPDLTPAGGAGGNDFGPFNNPIQVGGYPQPPTNYSQPTNYDASAMLGGQFTGDPWSVGRGARNKP